VDILVIDTSNHRRKTDSPEFQDSCDSQLTDAIALTGGFRGKVRFRGRV